MTKRDIHNDIWFVLGILLCALIGLAVPIADAVGLFDKPVPQESSYVKGIQVPRGVEVSA